MPRIVHFLLDVLEKHKEERVVKRPKFRDDYPIKEFISGGRHLLILIETHYKYLASTLSRPR